MLIARKKALCNLTRGFIPSQKTRHLTNTAVPKDADAIVIGGGSVGASTLYHLSKMGINAVLLEQAKLTSGTTWHSGGLVWRVRGSDTDTRLVHRTRELGKSLEEETGVSPGWVENGGLFFASTAQRMSEYKRISAMASFFGVESELMSAQDTKALYPLLNEKDLYGSLYSPGDGTLDPSGWVNSLVAGARLHGGRVFEDCGIAEILTEEFTSPKGTTRRVTGVRTVAGDEIRSSRVINCAGAWAPHIGAMAGVPVPLSPMQHAYVATTPIPDVKGLPNIRDDKSLYIKVQGDTLQIGGYEMNPVMLPELMPQSFSFSLYDLDWDVFAPHIEGAAHRIPIINESGIRSTVCGPESFTPDHKALMGEAPGLRGFYFGCGFNSNGIMLAGGAGEQLAKWVINGSPDIDMYSYDITRFYPELQKDREWVDETSQEAYAKNYCTAFKHDECMAGRNRRLDPFHSRLQAQGCVFEFRHGWERPGYFFPAVDAATMDPTVLPYDYYGEYGHTAHPAYGYLQLIQEETTFLWPKSHEYISNEVHACRRGVAVFNMSYFGKFYLSGPDAHAALEWLCTNKAPEVDGKTVYTNMCNERGGVVCDLTVSRLPAVEGAGAARYYIAAAGGTATHDWCWINSVLEDGNFDCQIVDETNNHGMLSIQGRHSQALLQELCSDPDDFELDNFPFSTCKYVTIAGHRVLALRLTFVGELGWELHIPNTACGPIYDALMEAGAKYRIANCGYRSIDTMSLEKGYKHYHEDLRGEDTPLEAGLAFACKLKTDIDFLGRSALLTQREAGLQKKLACFTLDSNARPLQGGEVIWMDGQIAGYLQRAEYGHTVGKVIGYGYVYHPDATEGGKITNAYLKDRVFEIETRKDYRLPARFHANALFDPKNKRIKGDYSEE